MKEVRYIMDINTNKEESVDTNNNVDTIDMPVQQQEFTFTYTTGGLDD
jgi:hypothetical protein